MRRRLLNLVTVLSLLLCVAMLALWVRSYWRSEGAELFAYHDQVHRSWELRSIRGEVAYVDQTTPRNPTAKEVRTWFYSYPSRAATLGGIFGSLAPTEFLGIKFLNVDDRVATIYVVRGIAVPHWFLVVLFAIFPALHLRAAIRSRRLRPAGHCPRCGYDLRATPARCPECGAVPAVK